MNKNIKFILFFITIVFALFLTSTIIMFALKLCPPPGPWPMPPWCAGTAYVEFEPESPDYILEDSEEIVKSKKELELLIGPFDIWGNPHLYIDLGEDTRDHVDTTMKKIGDIGSDGVFISDFSLISSELEVTSSGQEGIIEISDKELKDLVDKAKANNQKTIMLVKAIVDAEGAMRRYKNEDMSDTATEKLSDDQSEEKWEKVFDGWEKELLRTAVKAENTGVTHLVLTSGFIFYFFEDQDTWNEKFQTYADSVREKFSGRIGLQIQLHEIGFISDDLLAKVDFVIVNFEPATYTFKKVGQPTEDLTSIKTSLNKWFSLPEWKRLKKKDTYVSVIMPSYDGALTGGWIEPGAVYGPEYVMDEKEQALLYEGLFRTLNENDFGITGVISYGYWWTDRIYPDIKVIRNDLSHSIRNKEAEQVFAKWAKG